MARKWPTIGPAQKAVKFWRPAPAPPHSTAARWAAGLFEGALFVGVAAGLWSGAASAPGFAFFAAWALHLTLLHSIYASNLRYRLPLEPFLAVLAGAGLVWLWRRRK